MPGCPVARLRCCPVSGFPVSVGLLRDAAPLARVKLFTKWNSAIWTVWSVLARDHRDAVVDRAYREAECAARAVLLDNLGSMLHRIERDALIAGIVTRRETSATVDAHRGVNLGYDCLGL